MRFPSYLVLSRYQIYYFRFLIPEKLHPNAKRTDIKLSLDTRCPREAMYLSNALAYVGHRLIINMYEEDMDYLEIRNILHDHFTQARNRMKDHINKYGRLSEDRKRIYQEHKELATEALRDNDYFFLGTPQDISKIITRYELPIGEGSGEYQTLQNEYVRAYRDCCESILEYDSTFEKYNLTHNTQAHKSNATGQQRGHKKLADIYSIYEKEKLRLGRWKPATAAGYRQQIELMLTYVGADQSIHMPDDTADSIKRMLMIIPKNRIGQQYEGKSIHELIELGKKSGNGMSVANISKHLSTYSTFYTWAVKHKHTQENPFKVLVEDTQPEESKRHPFSVEEVQLIFSKLPEYARKPHQKWGGLIAAYSGARRNEIAQLSVSDIKEKDGIWYFDFDDMEDESKSLKNSASKRPTPIHSKLIEAGFLSYLEELKAKGEKRLFPALPYHQKEGYGRNLGRWYNNSFLEKIGLKNQLKVFHSFRHTVVTELLQAGVEEPIIKAIVGHAQEGITQKVYGNSYKLSQLKKALEKLPY